MATTYEAIATVTVTGATAANMEFTNIPGTYTDLTLMISCRGTEAGGTGNGNILIQFNSSTSNLSDRRLYGTGSGTGSDTDGAAIRFAAPSAVATASTFGNAYIYIPNYAGNTNKSVSTDAVGENNATASVMNISAGLWSNTAAITSIKLLPDASKNFVQYSTATLYGIKNS